MKKIITCVFVLSLLVFAAQGYAYQTAVPGYVDFDNTNTVNVFSVEEYKTTGGMMAGMKVTATYQNGDGLEAIWVGVTDEQGFAQAIQDDGQGQIREFKLSFDGDTYFANWVFDDLGDGAVTKLTIDALAGNTVFDVFDYGDAPNGVPNTEDSLRGFAFEYDTDAYANYNVRAVYRDLVAVGGNSAQKDLYGSLDIYFDPAFVTDGTGSFAFKADTDIIVPIPEPGTVLLLGFGVLGLFGYIRRQR